MERKDILKHIQHNVERLTRFDSPDYQYIPLHQNASPSVKAVREIMRLLRKILFPGFLVRSGKRNPVRLNIIPVFTLNNYMTWYRNRSITDSVLRWRNVMTLAKNRLS